MEFDASEVPFDLMRLAVLNVVGLTRGLIGEHTPRIARYLKAHPSSAIDPAFPAVTCTAQSNYLTGKTPSTHGIVGNGWYHRELSEVQFWKQSNHLVTAPKIWEELRTQVPNFTCAKLFWWYNMYSSADFSITPRPIYPADGRKVFDVYTWPYDLRPAIKSELGDFPFATFWGPAAGKSSPQGPPDAASRWIGNSARWIETKHSPTLSLVYLPHLDYNLQRFGPYPVGAQPTQTRAEIAKDLLAIDQLVGELLDFYAERNVRVIILSEYGITPVDQPIHINRILREAGWVTVKEELGLEILDPGNSKAFAVADHQVAHVYINDLTQRSNILSFLRRTPGIVEVLDESMKAARGVAHSRSGELIAVAAENAWVTYSYWLKDELAPDFARCVDIHRKPGYDPVELFLDPEIPAVQLKIAFRLLQKKLGFRMLMDVIPLKAPMVGGSHGGRPTSKLDWPICIGPGVGSASEMDSTDVYALLKKMLVNLERG